MAFIEKCYRPGRYEYCYSLFSTLNSSVIEISFAPKERTMFLRVSLVYPRIGK